LDAVQKFGPLSENSSSLLVSQAGYGPELIAFVVLMAFALPTNNGLHVVKRPLCRKPLTAV